MGLIISLPNAAIDMKSFENRLADVLTGLDDMDLETVAMLSDMSDLILLMLLTEMTNFDGKYVEGFNIFLFNKLLDIMKQISNKTEKNVVCVSFLTVVILFVIFDE